MGNKPVTLNETVIPKQAYENEVEIIGGLVLIGLGGKILAEHLLWI